MAAQESTDDRTIGDIWPVRTQMSVCGETIHLHQLVRHDRWDYVVVGLRKNEIILHDVAFEDERFAVSPWEWQVEEYEAVASRSGIPVFAY